MKKKLFFLPLFAAAVLSGCSNEDLPNGDEGSNDTNTSYLNISIVPTAAMGTRATAGDGEPETGAEYENGTSSENAVSKVRFYFFDAAGNAASVKAGSSVNFWDWTTPTGTGTDATGPVERQLDAVLIISTKAGDKLPEQLVAVLNPDENLGQTSLSLSELRKKYADYASLANAATSSFVMCNSVYAASVDNSLKEISATAIGMDKYATTESGATNNPVYVYVERNVAKVQVALGNGVSPDANGLIKVTKYDSETETGSDYTIGGKQVYVKFQGWDVTGDLNQAWLSKSIDPSWTNESLFGNATISWNYAPYFRSFWADECTAAGTANQYKSYNNAYSKAFDGFTYCNENAARSASKKQTQVIIPALLCDAEGNALSIYEYAGVQGISEDGYSALKKAYLSNLKPMYYKEKDGGRIGVEESDITFTTATKAGIITAGDAGAYYVVPCLKKDAPAKWYTQTARKILRQWKPLLSMQPSRACSMPRSGIPA